MAVPFEEPGLGDSVLGGESWGAPDVWSEAPDILPTAAAIAAVTTAKLASVRAEAALRTAGGAARQAGAKRPSSAPSAHSGGQGEEEDNVGAVKVRGGVEADGEEQKE